MTPRPRSWSARRACRTTRRPPCAPRPGALFAAGDVLSWLAAGAKSVDWWDMNNYGNTSASCVNPDYGMFTSSSPPVAETPYYGYVLASVLARPHALLATLGTSDPADVLAYQSCCPAARGGRLHQHQHQFGADGELPSGQPLLGQLQTWSYSAGNQNATNSNIVQGTASSSSLAHGISLPPESMVILEAR